MNERRRACPCCGYQTLTVPHPGSFELCPICWWEDDPIQLQQPDDPGGANQPSLRQAQRNFAEFGACERAAIPFVTRPGPSDVRDPEWRLLPDRTVA